MIYSVEEEEKIEGDNCGVRSDEIITSLINKYFNIEGFLDFTLESKIIK